MTREEIEQLNVTEPYCCETDREEQWYQVGLIDGLSIADECPRKGLWDSEKVCKYLEEHAGNYMTLENDEEGELQAVYYQMRLVKDLRKAMEE